MSVIVAVSGGFDPIHIGHIELFRQAKALGDELVVIVNNDNWLRMKKGFSFMPESERIALIATLPFVDRVVLTNHTPDDKDRSVVQSLREIHPHIFANGGDRGEANTPEAEFCEGAGIQMAYGIGGGKIQSSSWMLARALEQTQNFNRPWGSYVNHAGGHDWHLKTLRVSAGARLSLQKHRLRDELWILVNGDATVFIGESAESLQSHQLTKHEPFHVAAGTLHRIQSRHGCTIIEIINGEYLEGDIERVQDDYGRANKIQTS